MVEERRLGFRKQEWVAFTVGLAGLFVGTFIFSSYISYTPYPDITRSALFFLDEDTGLAAGNAIMVAAAAAILLWAFYEISVKHDHPRWHKIFFITSGLVVGNGVFLLFSSLTILFLVSTQEVLYTLAAAVLVGAIFATSIIAMELTYTLLRRKYESIAPKHPGRMLFWGIGMGLVCAVMLLLAIWQAQVLVVKGMNLELQHINAAKQEYVDAAQAAIAALPASQLKDSLAQKAAEAQAAEVAPLAPPTFAEVLQDQVIESRCAAVQESVRPIYSLMYGIRQLEEPAAGAEPGLLSSPIRYKPFDDLMACISQTVAP